MFGGHSISLSSPSFIMLVQLRNLGQGVVVIFFWGGGGGVYIFIGMGWWRREHCVYFKFLNFQCSLIMYSAVCIFKLFRLILLVLLFLLFLFVFSCNFSFYILFHFIQDLFLCGQVFWLFHFSLSENVNLNNGCIICVLFVKCKNVKISIYHK